MFFYQVAIIGSPLEPLTYQSSTQITSGTQIRVELNTKEKDAVVISSSEKPEFETNDILETTPFYFSHTQIKLAEFISTYYVCSLGDAFSIMTPFSKQNDEEKFSDELLYNSSITLSEKQKEALEFLQKHEVSLLFGDTGSGKTEIYMKMFEEALRKKKRCIFLMPEISLTPQMQQRLEQHFGDSVVMWHSKLTPKQKKLSKQKIEDGSAYIIAGPRSSLFLPVENLGLIVVDEEHDDSYKSASRPRYNARDLAIYMGKLNGAKVVLGSATPSLGSYVKFPHFR